MLYVFHVDVGRMINFDMNVAMSNVEILKETIERLHGIPAANIVLLVSGGETLQHTHQVSSYSAGTDTNPIYMFIKGDVRLQLPMAPITYMECDLELRDQVERCLELPATYETVVTRAHLALRMHEMARDEERLSFRLVHEQHLQQQGWYAAVANLEDVTKEFKQRIEWVCGIFDAHFSRRDRSLELLSNFGQDVTKLAQIPILPGLMPLAERDFLGFDALLEHNEAFKGPELTPGKNLVTTLEETESSGSSTSPNKKAKMGKESSELPITTTTILTTTIATTVTTTTTTITKTIKGDGTVDNTNTTNITPNSSTNCLKRRRNFNLLQWITTKENHSKLKLMSDETIQALGIFNVQIYEQLKNEAQNIIQLGQQTEIKEIKGLSDRLCKLEEFKYKIKAMVNDQKELSTAFQHNQHRANKLRDPTILPDLCASHQSQMQVMLQNHHKIREHRKLIARAKEELGSNLNTRLKRIIWIHNAMCAFDSRLLFYFRYMRRADRHIFIIRQINQAPDMYAAAVAETVRRKIFSSEFCTWATKLVKNFEVIRGEEVQRRKKFNSKFAGHFLNTLFPGMNEMPPTFTNEESVIFDARLPNLTTTDIDQMSNEVPELVPHISLPDMRPVINFFVSRSGEYKEQLVVEHLLKEVKSESANIDAEAETFKSDKQTGCDISTEFEKVNDNTLTDAVSTMNRSTTTDPLPLTISATTLTDYKDLESSENEKIAQKEVERLRSILNDMSKVAFRCIGMAREQMGIIREETTNLTENTKTELQLMQDKCILLKMQASQRELELEEMRTQFKVTNDESHKKIEKLTEKSIQLETELETLKAELQAAEIKANLAVSMAREELIHEQKTELEALRCRFKLMTSMDSMCSPSEGVGITDKSLTSDMISFSEHESILGQMRANLEAEKETTLAAAIESERAIWQAKLSVFNPESVMANVKVLREMLEEKEKQLDLLREHDLMQTKENYQLKTRLDALTNEECNSWMKEKIEFLNRDKCRLEEELNMERSRRAEMETSVAAVRSSSTTGLSNTKLYGHNRCISLESCNKGDIVFVVWNMRHGQYTIVQDSSSLYFVHGDSLNSLNLRLPTAISSQTQENLPTIPLPFYAIGRVFDKEYCAARKDENRYRVSKGSRFYRIKLSPLSTKASSSRRDRMESSSVSRSQSEQAPVESLSSESAATAIGILHSCSSAFVTTTMISTAAQTSTIASMTSKDMTDCAGSLSPSASSSTLTGASVSKERTISVTSIITDDGDEPLSLISDGGGSSGLVGTTATMRCRYLSVNEEDEYCSPSVTAHVQQQHQQSVITEQPTATISRCRLEMLANSAVLPQTINTNNTKQEQPSATSLNTHKILAKTIPETLSLSVTENDAEGREIIVENKEIDEDTQILLQQQQVLDNSTASSLHQTSFGGNISIATTSEDSDEYRSLEPKEFDDEQETEFTYNVGE